MYKNKAKENTIIVVDVLGENNFDDSFLKKKNSILVVVFLAVIEVLSDSLKRIEFLCQKIF